MRISNPACYECPKGDSKMHHWHIDTETRCAKCAKCNAQAWNYQSPEDTDECPSLKLARSLSVQKMRSAAGIAIRIGMVISARKMPQETATLLCAVSF